MFRKPVIYLQISPERISAKNLKSGAVIEDIPHIAISAGPKPRILAIGAQARAAASTEPATVENPFANLGKRVPDTTLARPLIVHFLNLAQGGGFLFLRPKVVIHPLGSPSGGFSHAELSAFRELALEAGAAEVHVHTGEVLTDQEVLAAKFDANHVHRK